MNWEFVPAQEHFEAARAKWDNLNRLQGDHILLDSEFTSALLRHFGSNAVRLGILQNSTQPAMVLVVPTRWGFWETFQPSQAPMGLAVFGYRDEHGACCSHTLGLLGNFPTISSANGSRRLRVP